MVYEGLVSIFIAGSIIILTINGVKNGWRKVLGLLLLEYIIFIYSSTVFSRDYYESPRYNFDIFWSYQPKYKIDTLGFITENIMNVLAFVPIGFLSKFVIRKAKWWNVLLFGFFISIMIESLQYFFHRGFSETDDVIHNTLGCMIGIGLYYLIQSIFCKARGLCTKQNG